MQNENNLISIPLRHIDGELTGYYSDLSYCKVCGGFEGTLTTHCIGRKLTAEENDKIYNQGFDYMNNKWEKMPDGDLPCWHRSPKFIN